MRVAVLGAADSGYVKDLERAARGQHDIVPLPFSRLNSQLQSGQDLRVKVAPTDLRQFDCILVRSMPPGSLEQVVFRMDALGRLKECGGVVINSPRAIEAAVDKYLALAKLQSAGLLVPTTIVCQTAEEAMVAFDELGGDVVVKPLFGSEGRGIARLTDPALALRAFNMLVQLRAVLYLQRFVPHEGHDLRLFVVGDNVLGMRRHHPADWRTNVSRGAQAQPLPVEPQLASLARRAANAVGAELAGVDLLPGRDGQLYAIEVNAVPGWRALAEAVQTDVAAMVLDYVQSVVRGRQA